MCTITFYFSERDERSMSGRERNRGDRDMGPDKTDSDWRARPKTDGDDGPRRDDAFGERKQLFKPAVLVETEEFYKV